MKKVICFLFYTIALSIGIFAFPSVTQAGYPKAYWQFQEPFVQATASNNQDEIIRLGNEIMNVFKYEPASNEKSEILFNTYDKMIPAYQNQGNYDMALSCLKAQLPYAKQLGFDDAVKLIEARINKIDPMTEVYALTESTNTFSFFSAKHEPKNGAYFGRTFSLSSDSPYPNESATAFYANCLSDDLSSTSFIDKPLHEYANGSRMILINYNMPNESSSVAEILQASSDQKIRNEMEYIASINGPVLLRIGGEVNVWTNLPDADSYKKAYIKIANIARQSAPNVALVFSPNDISAWNVDMNDYYPGDSYVDWVGVSLYTNLYRNSTNPSAGKDSDEMYYGNGLYANPITKLKEVVERYGNKKPIIITECAFGYKMDASEMDLTAFAKTGVNTLYSYVTMVYPQIKAIIYFDNKIYTDNKYAYALNDNPAVKTQYRTSSGSNKTFIQSEQTASNYTKADNYTDSRDTLQLFTYCMPVGNDIITVTYFLDGIALKSSTTVPYELNLAKASLTPGEHELKVDIKNQKGIYSKTKLYTLKLGADGIITIKNK